jgi:Flp pilus assembly pilin Flp
VERTLQKGATGTALPSAQMSGDLVKQFFLDDRAQDLIEYAFLAIFIALAVTVGLTAITGGLNTGMSNIGTQVSSGS